MIVKFECALCWISMQTTTNLTALWAYISYSSAIKWWPSAQWSIVLLNDSDSKMYFCYLKDGQPKNLYIHLSVHYILNIFGGLHCLQTAAWCGAGTAVLVCRNMNIVQLRKSSPKEKGCSTAALLQRSHFVCVFCGFSRFLWCLFLVFRFSSCVLPLLTSLFFPPHLSCICLFSPVLLPGLYPSLLSLHTCTSSPLLAFPLITVFAAYQPLPCF